MSASTGRDSTAIELRLGELLTELSEAGAEMMPATELAALDIDSLDLAEIAHVLAEEFGVELRTEQLERVATIGDLVAAVAGRIAEAAERHAPGDEAPA